MSLLNPITNQNSSSSKELEEVASNNNVNKDEQPTKKPISLISRHDYVELIIFLLIPVFYGLARKAERTNNDRLNNLLLILGILLGVTLFGVLLYRAIQHSRMKKGIIETDPEFVSSRTHPVVAILAIIYGLFLLSVVIRFLLI